ncbi:hypothetical protein HNQ91_002210 [Filimonas zeae]|nr:hypothetical protein [Filimonas zeae]MDR6339159.1 hypothetical protein [Filimonas zeae]
MIKIKDISSPFFMRPDYPSKLFTDQRNTYTALIAALAMDSL